jgi:hypothetical protein
MRFFLCAAIFVALFPVVANAAGLASGDNFSIFTPAKPSQEAGDRYANLVLERAEAFRAEFAKEWLGEELPAGEGRTLISIDFSVNENTGLTLAKDHPDRRFHRMFLASTAENAAGSILRHEIVHTVLATRYPHPNRLPSWVEEGIACRYDNQRLIAVRQQEVRAWTRMGRIPSLAVLFDNTGIRSTDDTGYAAAESLVAFLLTRGDKQTLLRFAEDIERLGWHESLRTHYAINGQAQLQRDWQAWLVDYSR